MRMPTFVREVSTTKSFGPHSLGGVVSSFTASGSWNSICCGCIVDTCREISCPDGYDAVCWCSGGCGLFSGGEWPHCKCVPS